MDSIQWVDSFLHFFKCCTVRSWFFAVEININLPVMTGCVCSHLCNSLIRNRNSTSRSPCRIFWSTVNEFSCFCHFRKPIVHFAYRGAINRVWYIFFNPFLQHSSAACITVFMVYEYYSPMRTDFCVIEDL